MRRVGIWFLGIAVLLSAGSVSWRFIHPRRERPPAPTYVRIDVVNGCGVPRAGREVMREMLVAGFNVYAVRNSVQHHERTAVVELVDPDGRNARAVAEALVVPRRLLGMDIGLGVRPDIRIEIDSTRFVDAEVVIGTDYPTYFPGARPAY